MGARETALHSGQPSGGRSSGHLTLVQWVNPEETLSHEFLRQHQKFTGPSQPSFTSLPKAHGGRGPLSVFREGAWAQGGTCLHSERPQHSAAGRRPL